MPKTPEQWLAAVSPPRKTRGTLKLFLGYAPGVGKTYTMLSEAIRRHSRGEDIVIGVVETHGRKAIADLAAMLEAVPRRKIEYKGTVFEEMDVDAILARKPRVVLIDELAHTNIPGSRHRKRYEDVLEVLASGIDVLSTVNVQHLESIAPTVRTITGIHVRETVPDWVVHSADETVMIDLTPEALQNRMKRGDVYAATKVEQALRNFFRRGNLIALRELALRQVAEQVDRTLESYMEQKDIQATWPVRERLAVCISSNPKGQYLIARAARMAAFWAEIKFTNHLNASRRGCGRAAPRCRGGWGPPPAGARFPPAPATPRAAWGGAARCARAHGPAARGRSRRRAKAARNRRRG